MPPSHNALRRCRVAVTQNTWCRTERVTAVSDSGSHRAASAANHRERPMRVSCQWAEWLLRERARWKAVRLSAWWPECPARSGPLRRSTNCCGRRFSLRRDR